MEQDTLAEILRVETELREQLDDERARAAAWLAEARRQAEASHEQELAALEAAEVTGGSAAAQEADEEAASLVAEAREAARHSGQLQPDELRSLVRRHLAVLRPGGAT